ncbi:MAG: acyltransferase [Actinobacteria bacterium]|nr:acyltransferase [Actinomycetota bacterium]
MILTHDHAVSRALAARGVAQEWDAAIEGSVEIHSNAFVGARSVLLPGVSVGEGAIVGAGSVVTKDVPAMTVVAGNPASRVCSTKDYVRRQVERHGTELLRFASEEAIRVACEGGEDQCD